MSYLVFFLHLISSSRLYNDNNYQTKENFIDETNINTLLQDKYHMNKITNYDFLIHPKLHTNNKNELKKLSLYGTKIPLDCLNEKNDRQKLYEIMDEKEKKELEEFERIEKKCELEEKDELDKKSKIDDIYKFNEYFKTLNEDLSKDFNERSHIFSPLKHSYTDDVSTDKYKNMFIKDSKNIDDIKISKDVNIKNKIDISDTYEKDHADINFNNYEYEINKREKTDIFKNDKFRIIKPPVAKRTVFLKPCKNFNVDIIKSDDSCKKNTVKNDNILNKPINSSAPKNFVFPSKIPQRASSLKISKLVDFFTKKK